LSYYDKEAIKHFRDNFIFNCIQEQIRA
jgi:hypothetical protein